MSRFKLEVGAGMPLFAAAWLALLASLLPSFTSQLGPPNYIHIYTKWVLLILSTTLSFYRYLVRGFTSLTESLAAMANISAQETTPGQTFSTADLMSSITLNPRAEFRFGTAFFSPVNDDVSSSSNDPSHPYHPQLYLIIGMWENVSYKSLLFNEKVLCFKHLRWMIFQIMILKQEHALQVW